MIRNSFCVGEKPSNNFMSPAQKKMLDLAIKENDIFSTRFGKDSKSAMEASRNSNQQGNSSLLPPKISSSLIA